MNKYINNKDFENVGLVANTCSFKKLNQAIEEAYEFDMLHIFNFDFIKLLLDHWEAQDSGNSVLDDIIKIAINGGTYVVPNSNPQRLCSILGFKRIWVYYAYSKYVTINQFDDTPVGLKFKESQFSTGVGMKDLLYIENKYKNMAKDAIKHLREFLCHVKDYVPEYDSCNCLLSCGCSGSCKCKGKSHKLTGFRFKTVEK